MSMTQIEPYINLCPLATSMSAPQAPWVYYFLYAYNECDNFPKICPEAHKIGIATLQDWIWHINVKGKPNVRKMFYNGSDPHQTGVRSLTVGWVYRVEKSADERMHAIFGVDRVRMGQLVSITNPKCPGKPIKLPVVLYWDPRNTCGSDRWECNEEELRKWMTSISALKEAGVPRWYLERIGNLISQRKTSDVVDYKTICFDPRDLSYPEPTTFKEPPRPAHHKPHTPHYSRHRTEDSASRLPKNPKKPSSRPYPTPPQSTPQEQVTPEARSDPRPQPTAHSKSTPQPQTTPRPKYATPLNGVMGPPSHPRSTTPTSTHLGPNIKQVKKRKPDAGKDGGQPAKKQMLKKMPAGPSTLRHGTSAI